MDRDAWDLEPDPVQRALDAVTPRSAGQVVREAFYGTRRFDDFARRTGLTPGPLSARLRELVADGVLERVEYHAPRARRRHEYRLTAKGRDLAPAIIALLRWADRWLPDPAGPTVDLVHVDCGAPVHVELRCADGHHVTRLRDVRAQPGPGARPA